VPPIEPPPPEPARWLSPGARAFVDWVVQGFEAQRLAERFAGSLG
jgi:hypothetical protein